MCLVTSIYRDAVIGKSIHYYFREKFRLNVALAVLLVLGSVSKAIRLNLCEPVFVPKQGYFSFLKTLKAFLFFEIK